MQLTRDGAVVVIHDPTVDRTTNGSGRVGELTLREIRALHAGYPQRFGAAYAGERVPTLAEALAFLRERARVLVELKKESVSEIHDGGGIEALTIEAVRSAGMASDVALLSFDRRALHRCRELAPELRRGHLFYRASVDEVLAGAREVDCDLVMPEKGMLSDELSGAARAAGLRLATWVVDDPEELRALLRYDLFAVGTNRPGELIEATLEAE